MKVTEHRIGNWIKVNRHPEKIDSIGVLDWSTTSKDGVCYGLDGGNYDSEEDDVIVPLPLTPEILGKARFNASSDGVTFTRETPKQLRINLINVADRYYICSVAGPFGMINTPHLYSVHQLQNLYFVLTGEELEINL